jgi:predicted SprT family Zn-dependent metalloprotease
MPRAGNRYRCHNCRLDLVFDAQGKMVVAATVSATPAPRPSEWLRCPSCQQFAGQRVPVMKTNAVIECEACGHLWTDAR